MQISLSDDQMKMIKGVTQELSVLQEQAKKLDQLKQLEDLSREGSGGRGPPRQQGLDMISSYSQDDEEVCHLLNRALFHKITHPGPVVRQAVTDSLPVGVKIQESLVRVILGSFVFVFLSYSNFKSNKYRIQLQDEKDGSGRSGVRVMDYGHGVNLSITVPSHCVIFHNYWNQVRQDILVLEFFYAAHRTCKVKNVSNSYIFFPG